jgi:uncharacterized SAM-binding protein YcdF (DUF218 family)
MLNLQTLYASLTGEAILAVIAIICAVCFASKAMMMIIIIIIIISIIAIIITAVLVMMDWEQLNLGLGTKPPVLANIASALTFE